MTVQSLNALFGMSSTKESAATGTLAIADHSSQTNNKGKIFLAVLENSMENSEAVGSHNPKQVVTKQTLSNQEDINDTTETSMKDLLAKQELNIDKETFINNGIGYVADGEGISALAKTMGLSEEAVSTIAKSLRGGDEISTIAKTMGLSEEAVSTIARSLRGGDEISTIAKTMGLSEETVSTLTKSLKGGEEISAIAKTMGLSEKTVSTIARSLRGGEEISTLAKTMGLSEDAVSTVAKLLKGGGDISTIAKTMRLSEEAVSTVAKSLRGGEEISTIAKTMRLSEDVVSAIAKSWRGGEEISTIAKSINGFDSQNNADKGKGKQLVSQIFNKTSPENSNANPLETESNEFPHTPNVSKSPHTATSVNNNGINNINTSAQMTHSGGDESAIQANTSLSNSLASEVVKDLNINLTNIKQETEPKVNTLNSSRQISVSQHLESLRADVADNVVQKARLFMKGGASGIRVQLNPPELGSIKLEFRIVDNNLEAKIVVEKTAVKDIIEKDIPRIRELIASTDVDVRKLDVLLQEKESDRFSFLNKDFQSDSGDQKSQDLTEQEKEDLDLNDEADEELALSDVDSNEINYLV